MENDYKETLIHYLSALPSSSEEVEKLVVDNIITNEEAAVLNMRIAAQKLDQKVNSLVQKMSGMFNEDLDELDSRANC